MRRILQFILEHKRSFTLLVTLLFSLSMIFMGKSSKVSFARGVTTTVFNTGRFTFSWGIYLLDQWRENKRLRLQNLKLSEKIQFHDFVIRENERLRRILDFKERNLFADSVVTATVIGHDFDRVVNSLILDVGTKDGVKKHMAVVTAEGLAGNVFEVYSSSCSVQIIMDVKARISAETEGIQGIIRWEGGPYLRMYGLPISDIPSTGQKVYTTGMGGVYPPGIFIGNVTEQKLDEVEQYASVNVESMVDFARVREAFILKGSERSDIWDDGDGSGYFQRPDTQ
ncbi:rod shape-determining protein MreC [Candidatus Latescibacterota bacterium]